MTVRGMRVEAGLLNSRIVMAVPILAQTKGLGPISRGALLGAANYG